MAATRIPAALASHPMVQKELHELGQLLRAGIRVGIKVRGVFHPVHDLRVANGHATYRTGLYQFQRYSLTEEVKRLTGLQNVRWLNYVFFKDLFGRIIPVKKFVAEKHGLRFT
jgi:hypothetical protein